MPIPSIQIEHVSKLFYPKNKILHRAAQGHWALTDVSLDIYEGEVMGLLGPNGAGKTTLLKVLTSFIIQDTGSIRIFGLDTIRDFDQMKNNIGFVLGEERSFFWRLSGWNNLEYFGMLQGLPPRQIHERSELLLKQFGLWEARGKMFMDYSTGMRRKLSVARGLLDDRKVYFYDEPTSNIDPLSAIVIRRTIAEQRMQGKTIILATHNMDEATRLCDRVTILKDGRIVATGRPEEVTAMVTEYLDMILVFEVSRAPSIDTIGVIEMLPDVKHVDRNGKRITVTASSLEQTLQDVMTILTNANLRLVGVNVQRPTLEDAFVRIAG